MNNTKDKKDQEITVDENNNIKYGEDLLTKCEAVTLCLLYKRQMELILDFIAENGDENSKGVIKEHDRLEENAKCLEKILLN